MVLENLEQVLTEIFNWFKIPNKVAGFINGTFKRKIGNETIAFV